MTDYTPIDCGRYSEYELAILQGRRLRITWRDADGQSHIDALLPVDLRIRDHAEYLVATDQAGHRHELRLDYIDRTEAL